MAYDIYCAFDLEKHKQTYVQYLEVVILEDGTVEYAVPSHQEKLIALACQKKGVSRQELNDLCPREYYYDSLYAGKCCGCVEQRLLLWPRHQPKAGCDAAKTENGRRARRHYSEDLGGVISTI